MAGLQESISLMENEVLKTKQKIGEIVNAVMDSNQDELIDKVTSVLYENNE